MVSIKTVNVNLIDAGKALRSYAEGNGGAEGIRRMARDIAAADPAGHELLDMFRQGYGEDGRYTERQMKMLNDATVYSVIRTANESNIDTEAMRYLLDCADVIAAVIELAEARKANIASVREYIVRVNDEYRQQLESDRAKEKDLSPAALLARIEQLEKQQQSASEGEG